MSSSYNFDPGSAFQLRKDARYTTSSCSGDSSRSCIACVLTKLEGDSSRILGVEHEQLGFRPVTTCSHRMHKPDGKHVLYLGLGDFVR
ncbi:hypothetical protein M758_5G123600 [Ceratodon purpureus]|nr:hypothetical protein M758_5G123600 [Ceratodon purpureus]